MAVLERMRRLTLDGVAPADAARAAIAGPPPEPTPPAEAEFPGVTQVTTPKRLVSRARGLARAALALDAAALRDDLTEAVAENGVIVAWDSVLAPVLRAIGERCAATGEGVEIEHLVSEVAIGVFARVAPDAPPPPRPVLLSAADGERHTLPLHALSAALGERRVGTRMLGAALPPPAMVAAVRRCGPAVLVVYAQQREHAQPALLDAVPVLRPPTLVVAGGAGWAPETLPARVAYAHDLGEAVHLVLVATGSA